MIGVLLIEAVSIGQPHWILPRVLLGENVGVFAIGAEHLLPDRDSSLQIGLAYPDIAYVPLVIAPLARQLARNAMHVDRCN